MTELVDFTKVFDNNYVSQSNININSHNNKNFVNCTINITYISYEKNNYNNSKSSHGTIKINLKEIYNKLNGQFINGPRPQEYIDIRNSGKTEWFPALNEYIMFFIFRPDQSSKSTFGETCKSNSFFIFVLLLIIALMAYIFYTNKSVINLPFKRSMFGRRR